MYADATVPCFLDLFVFDYVEADSVDIFDQQDFIRGAMIERMSGAEYYQDWLARGYTEGIWSGKAKDSLARKIAEEFLTTEQLLRDGQVIRDDRGAAIMWGFDNLGDSNGYRWVYAIDDILPVGIRLFEGVSCCAPRNTEKLLHDAYGDYNSLPADITTQSHVRPPEDPRERDELERRVRRMIQR